MWFAIMDQEFSKQELLEEPYYYKLGYKNQSFNTSVFWRWIIYGIWQAALIMLICFYCVDAEDELGQQGTLLLDGQFCFLAVVTMVNIKVLTSTNTHTGWSLFFCFGCIGCYILFFYIINLIEDDVMGLFPKVFTHNNLYFGLVFISMALILVDNGIHLAQKQVYNLFKSKEKKAILEAAERRKTHKPVPRKTVTNLGKQPISLV